MEEFTSRAIYYLMFVFSLFCKKKSSTDVRTIAEFTCYIIFQLLFLVRSVLLLILSDSLEKGEITWKESNEC